MTQIKGSIAALVTPFKEGQLDLDAFQNLIEWHIANGTHGLVPCGTTGETPTLTHEEHRLLIDTCIDTVKGRIPVIAGTGSNCTEEAIDLACHAEKKGADAILVVTPYYNKPTEEGIFEHYKAIHDETSLPIILYNVPSRTGSDLSVEMIVRLAELDRVVGIKDASADLSRPLELRLALGDDFIQLSGEDATVAAFLAQGGHGCISVTANIAPKLCADLHNAWQKKDLELFNKIRDMLLPLHISLFIESNPAPAKYCLSQLGKCRDELRLPLVSVTEATQEELNKAMSFAKIEKEKSKAA